MLTVLNGKNVSHEPTSTKTLTLIKFWRIKILHSVEFSGRAPTGPGLRGALQEVRVRARLGAASLQTSAPPVT